MKAFDQEAFDEIKARIKKGYTPDIHMRAPIADLVELVELVEALTINTAKESTQDFESKPSSFKKWKSNK